MYKIYTKSYPGLRLGLVDLRLPRLEDTFRTYSIFEGYIRTLLYSVLAYVNKNRIRCNYNKVV